ncbi:MAG: alpha/beta hydrolase family esterase [Vulcanimicrobiaceae bacterium]
MLRVTSLLLATVLAGTMPAGAPLQHRTLRVGVLTRRYDLVVPVHVDVHPALVIVLHGLGSTANDMERYVRFEAASGNSAVVVYPQGIRRRWNDARGTDIKGPDDIAFLRAIVTTIQARYHIDANRVFLTGMSNGGMMTLTAACEMPQITAVAAVVASLPASLQKTCAPQHPVSLFLIVGDADPIVP